jgi:peptidoglycan/xylan/chitin deacetylase (PgdA/CDA1 family)
MGLQLPDLYLLSAECKARLNDLQGATADIETLRKNRMPATDAAVPATIAGDQTTLIRFIFDERVREFAAEGYRWFDMRRQSVDPLFAGQVFTHTLHKADGTIVTYTLKQPNRLTLQLPPTLVNANPGMPNNP